MKKKILVTGACGFIGSHLTEYLVHKGHDVVAFDRYNSEGSWGWLEHTSVKNDVEVALGDIRDFDSVLHAARDVDGIFHLAALIGIPYSYTSPLAYIRTNIEGTYNVLEVARMLNTPELIVTSTSETYGSAQYVPIDELHPKVGQSPYAASKVSADQLAMSYYLSFNLPVKIARPFNTYGPRQSARAIIPTIISQAFSKKFIQLGSLHPTRDLTYVKDTCSGFYEIFRSNKLYGEEVNIGMSNEISIEELANKILKKMKKDLPIKTEGKRLRPEKSEVNRLFCDNQKIIKSTKWSPEYTLEKGLEETIAWFSEPSNLAKYKSTYQV